MQPRRGFALSYVRVEIRSRAPRLWGWSLRRIGSDDLLQRSEGGYGCAEDAWKAGRLAHARYEAGALRSLISIKDEEDFAEEEPVEVEELAC